MQIRKAKKDDFDGYYKLKKEEEKGYSQLIQGRISKKEYKKDFDGIFSSIKNILLVMEENNKLIGFLYGQQINKKEKKGCIQVIFVSKRFRKKGVAGSLITGFIKIIKQKSYKKIQLSVDAKNIGAIRLYRNFGFKILKHEIIKKL